MTATTTLSTNYAPGRVRPARPPAPDAASAGGAPGEDRPDPAVTLRLLDQQERRAVGRGDFSDANRILLQRLRLKAQLLQGSPRTLFPPIALAPARTARR